MKKFTGMFTDFKIVKKCKTTNARVSTYELATNTLHLPVFMPVATYGAMRGVVTSDLEEEIILSNTYHLRDLNRNIKDFMGWNKSMLTDSGGFQIQSLPNVSVTDDGVVFDGKLFKPEDSMDIQMKLGADIMMQLDDVVNPMMPREEHTRAIKRSIEWLDRAIVHINKCGQEAVNKIGSDEDESEDIYLDGPDNGGRYSTCKRIRRNGIPMIEVHDSQVIFPIIQGGLEDDLRLESIREILLRKPKGLAIGGLSGGENKNDFYRTIYNCCINLPDNIPRYLMGVGYPEDIVVCCALGTDMSDCVYPTRTARFGRGFCDDGDVMIGNGMIMDLDPICKSCRCTTCKKYSRAYLATIKGSPVFCMLMSRHNLFYMRDLTDRIRKAIFDDLFPEFIKRFMNQRYEGNPPSWIVDAVRRVGVEL